MQRALSTYFFDVVSLAPAGFIIYISRTNTPLVSPQMERIIFFKYHVYQMKYSNTGLSNIGAG